MNKIIDIIFNALLTLLFIFCFSNGAVYFLKNVNKEDSFYLSILLASLIVELFFIIKQYKSLSKNFKDYKDEK